MRKRAFLLAGLFAALVCLFRGHRPPQRVPFLGGHRCPGCGRALDPEFVNPDRRRFYRPERHTRTA